MKTAALLSALAATICTVSAQAYASAGVNVNVAASAVAVAGGPYPPAPPPPVVTGAPPVVVVAPPRPFNGSCPTCPITTIYEVAYVSVGIYGIVNVPYTITTACPGGCVIDYEVCPYGFQTTVLHCAACPTPGPVTCTVPVAPVTVVAVPTLTKTVYAPSLCPTAAPAPVCPGGPNCPAVAVVAGCPGGTSCPVATPAVGCPGGPNCPVSTVVVGCPGGASCPRPNNSTYLWTSAASMTLRWEGMTLAIASVVLGMLLL